MTRFLMAAALMFVPLSVHAEAALNEPPARTYFPMDVGSVWVYKADGSDIDFRLTVLRKETFDGKECFVVETKTGENGRRFAMFYWSGGDLMQIKNEASSFKPYITFLSSSLEPGRRWTWEGETSPSEVAAPDVFDAPQKESWSMEILKSESVKTEAGTFQCIPVRYIQKDANGRILLETVRWCAPNVGRVKIEHTSYSGGVAANKSVVELKEFKRGN